MTNHLQLGHHPDADDLSAFAENAMAEHEREQTLEHLAQCARCREIVALALPPQEMMQAVPARAAVHPLAGWFRGWRLAFPATAALAATGLIALHWRQPSNVPAPAQIAERRPAPLIVPGNGDGPPSTAVPPPNLRARRKASSVPHREAAPPFNMNSVPSAENASISNPSLQGRNLQNVAPTRRLGGGPHSQQAVNLSPPSQAADAPQPASESVPGAFALNAVPAPATAQATSEVNGAAAQIEMNNASVAGTIPPDSYALPSRLAVANVLTRGSRTLALDTAGALFASNDAGATWKTIGTPWKGRAVRLESAFFAANREIQSYAASAPSSAGSTPAHLPARLSGAVRDASGAALPGAALLLHLGDASRAATSTDEQGRYTLPCGAGLGTLEISAPGFAPQSIAVMLNEGESKVQDVTLLVGQVSETVTVTSETRVVPAQRAQKKAPLSPSFEVITDLGERWTSADGTHWKLIR